MQYREQQSLGEVQRPAVGRHAQRPAMQGDPPQQSPLAEHTSPTPRHWPQAPLRQMSGGQQSLRISLGVQRPPVGTHIGRGRHCPSTQALGEQQSASEVHMASRGRHGGWHRRARHTVGAQQSESVTHTSPALGQGCQRR